MALGSASLAMLKNKGKETPAAVKAAPAKAATAPAKAATPAAKPAAKAATAAPAKAVAAGTAPAKKGISVTTKPAAAAQPAADQVQVAAEDTEVDISAMSEEELASFMEANGIEPLENWEAMSLDEKKAALQAEEPEPAAATPAPAKAVAAKPAAKPVAKTAAKKAGPVDENDLIAVTAHELENLGEEEARTLVGELQNETELNTFKLGGVLAKVQENNWFQPHESFRAYIETEHNIQYRKAMYFIGIYNTLVNVGIPYSMVAHIGWTKLKAISPVLTKQNAKKWIALAEKQNLVTLEQSVKQSQTAGDKKDGAAAKEGMAESLPLKSKTFKFHEDQAATVNEAIAKAKTASGSDVDAAAMEFICLDYLGGTGPNLVSLLQGAGLDAALEAFAEAFPNVNLSAEVPEEQAAA